MTQPLDPQEVLKLFRMLTPRALPRLAYLMQEDLSLSDVQDRGVRSDATLTDDIRYPRPADYPLGAENAHGEVEIIDSVAFTHWYADADGIVWHFVTTGDPSNEPLVLVHGFPESWYTFHHQMRDLSDQFYCIAVDTLGNGQSDKRLDLDYGYPSIAASLVKMLDQIGIDRFNLGGHDRGSVICDHLANGRVEFIDGNHFFQLCAPEATSNAMRAFLNEPLP